MPNFYNSYQYPYNQMPIPVPLQNQYQQPANQPQPQTQPQIQNGGFVSVQNEAIARNYPVAPGNSITFKDENAPYVYTKTMGFSQLDRPIFEKFKLVKEDVAEASNLPQNDPLKDDTMSETIESIKGEIKAIWNEIDGIKKKPVVKSVKKKEVSEDDPE